MQDKFIQASKRNSYNGELQCVVIAEICEMNIHIGEKIAEVLESKGITKRKFAKLINTGERNRYDLFKRDSIDTVMLQKISEVLDYDFFKLYVNQTRKSSNEVAEPVEQYKPAKSLNLTFHLEAGQNKEKAAELLDKMNKALTEFLESE